MHSQIGCTFCVVLATFSIPAGVVQAGEGDGVARHALAIESEDGTVIAGERMFADWPSYFASDYFRVNNRRCGTMASLQQAEGPVSPRDGSASDCTMNYTNPAVVYDPSVVKYRIPIVVHVLRNSTGSQGNLSAALIQSQIDILNEDYLALAGTPGALGLDVQIEFYLATTDPAGNPTTGITYSNNTTWFNDGGTYYNSLAWDTNHYLNIYTNTAGGYLGYVPDLPQGGGLVGTSADRVVIHYQSFGRNSAGDPYDQGRTATHEIGHYLGLWHPFDNGCGTSSCSTTGDRICDTPKQSSANWGCSAYNTCSTADDYRNYMDYTDDTCMTHFTSDQARRMRCSLEHYRPNLYEIEFACSFSPDADMNGDTFVNGADIRAFAEAVTGSPTNDEVCHGDYNDSGDLDAGDIPSLVSALLAG